MDTNSQWYLLEKPVELDTPALVVYPDRIRYNIAQAIAMVDDISRLRPHVKTNKTKEVCQLMMKAGISKFKCATIAEAEMLALADAKDVLLAYQPNAVKLQRLIRLIKTYRGTRYSFLIDDLAFAKHVAEVFSKEGLVANVFIDLNVGMNRTGIPPGEKAFELYSFCMEQSSIDLVGLHAYDGHLHMPDYEQRKTECDKAFALVMDFKKTLLATGFPEPVIVAGGSPTFPIHAKRENIECSPGTFIFWDKGYSEKCAEQPFLPAAVLVTRVLSLPAKNRVCVDLGHKSVAAENELQRRVWFLDAEGFNPVSQSEEHLVLETNETHNLSVGDVLYGLPFHICPTVALYERLYTIENGKVTGEWKVLARDRKISV